MHIYLTLSDKLDIIYLQTIKGHNMNLTITDKQNYLRFNRGITTVRDWELLTDDIDLSQLIVDDLNASFETILDTLEKKGRYSFREVGKLFASAMKKVCNKYDPTGEHGHYGLQDSEAQVALARYIALNIDISMYNYARHNIKW